MEEERKEEIVVNEPEQPEQKQEGGRSPQSSAALTSFILAMIGFVVSFAWLFAIAGIILGAISLKKGKGNNPETEQQPFRVFGRIAKPVAIVDIILGIGMFILYLVLFIIAIAGVIVAASEGAAA